MHFRFHPF